MRKKMFFITCVCLTYLFICNLSFATRYDYEVPYISQLDYSEWGQSACGPTSIAMILQYWYPNSNIDVPEVYHAATQANGYYATGNGAPLTGYYNVGHQTNNVWQGTNPDTALNRVPTQFRQYHIGNYSGMNRNFAASYLTNIWGGIVSDKNQSIENIVDEIKKRPTILNVDEFGYGGHYVVLRGYDDNDTPDDYSDDSFYINDPYMPYVDGGGGPFDSQTTSANNRLANYNTLINMVAGRYLISFQPRSDHIKETRNDTVLIDNGVANFGDEGNLNSNCNLGQNCFEVDDVNAKNENDQYVWLLYHSSGNDWIYPIEDNHSVFWRPHLNVEGLYKISALFKKDQQQQNVKYIVYSQDNESNILVNQQGTGWDRVLLGFYFADNGSLVRVDNVPANCNIDTIIYEKMFVPILSRSNSPTNDNYNVFGLSHSNLYGFVQLEGDYYHAGIIVRKSFLREDLGNPEKSANPKYLTEVGNQDNDNVINTINNFTGHNVFDSGDYLFSATVNDSDGRRYGYPLKYSILKSKYSKIIDNDQINNATSTYRQISDSEAFEGYSPGYYLSSQLIKIDSQVTGIWEPFVKGYYKIFAHIPNDASATEIQYDIAITEDNVLLSEPVSHIENQNCWVSLKTSDSNIFELNTNSYVQLRIGENSPNQNVNNNTTVAFDAIKFVYDPISNGLSWAKDQQESNGSWQYNIGYTSLLTLAFLNAGYTEDDSVVSKGIKYILSQVKNDGGIYDNSSNDTYMTSCAIMTLVATSNELYQLTITNAQNHLVAIQNDDGGWGYSNNSRSDVSNTQFPLMALSASEYSPNHNVWTNAITYIESRQQEDGGGISYHPDYSTWASMTAAGLWSYRLCGVSENDQRVLNAIEWLRNNDEEMTFTINTSHNNKHRYYYYMSFAKAMAISFLSPNQQGAWYQDWYDKLETKIASEQNADGSWNVGGDGYYGDTAFAILALQSQQPLPSTFWVSVTLASPADLVIYDPNNRICSKDECIIPEASFSIDEYGKQIAVLPELEAGHYRFVLLGTGDGTCHLTVRSFKGDPDVPDEAVETNSIAKEVEITKHEVIVSDALFSSITGALTMHIEEPNVPIDPISGNELTYDFNADNSITTEDILLISQKWNSEDNFFDLDSDGKVSVMDIMKVAATWIAD